METTQQDIIKCYNLITKDLVAELVTNTIARIESGEIDPRLAIAQAVGFEKVAKEVRKAAEDLAHGAFLREDTDKIEFQNAKVSKRLSVKYDYSVSPEWVNLTDEIDELAERRKQLEESLKVVNNGVTIKDATGTEINKVNTIAKSTIVVTLK